MLLVMVLVFATLIAAIAALPAVAFLMLVLSPEHYIATLLICGAGVLATMTTLHVVKCAFTAVYVCFLLQVTFT